MPVPKRKRSRARRDSRHANKGLALKPFTYCANCKKAISPHIACPECGFYKGEKVMKTKLDRGLKRQEKKPKQAKEETTEPKES
jgi:large subunit ribosomal protein L32